MNFDYLFGLFASAAAVIIGIVVHESAHALAYAFKKAREMTEEQSMIVCLSGRGDKDVNTIADYLEGKEYLN